MANRVPKSAFQIPPISKELLDCALTHRSFSNIAGSMSNERLEFLGDAALDLIIGEELFNLHPDWDQGQLSKARAFIVKESSLAEAAKSIRLQELIKLGTSEIVSGGHDKPSLLSDTFEAVIAAIYLDKGLQTAREWVLNVLRTIIEKVTEDELNAEDYKSRLQEILQKTHGAVPTYRLIREAGEVHQREFTIEAILGESAIGCGVGKSKKDAEQEAARDALSQLTNIN